MGFVKYNDTDWTRDMKAQISVEDVNGSKVLKVTRPENGVPVVAIDCAALLGDKLSSAKSISIDLGINVKGDKFTSASGTVKVIKSDGSELASVDYANYKKDLAIKTVDIDLNDELDNGSYIYLAGFSDTATSNYSDFLMDNIVFYDGNYDSKAKKHEGSAIPVNASSTFAIAGFGEFDWSNGTKKPTDEKLLFTGGETGTGWWPKAENSMSFVLSQEEVDANKDIGYSIDPDEVGFGPGSVLTVYYSVPDKSDTEKAWTWIPYFRAQNWEMKVEEKDEAGNIVYEKNDDGTDKLDDQGNPVPKMVALEDDGSGWYTGIIDCQCHNFSTDGNGDVDTNDDGTLADHVCINKSYTIGQYYYEDFVAGVDATKVTSSDPWYKFCDFIGVADKSTKLNIQAVTIGKLSE